MHDNNDYQKINEYENRFFLLVFYDDIY
jgi:hypothetical protein